MLSESAPQFGSTILIIDDSPENLRVLSKTLTLHGYTVRCVTTGAMAFVSIQNSPPDLILLDIQMPEMDGYEVCRRLKQNPSFQNIPIIFLSALGDVKNIVAAFQIGGVDYITKPFQTEEVLARINNQLTIQKLKDQLSAQNQDLLCEIDERKNFEQALCQEIQRRILIEASLQDARDIAESANYIKNEFLAQISHDLRTPLNVILGFTALMKETDLTQQQQNYLDTIDESAQRLLKSINNVLSITHTTTNKLTLHQKEFNLHDLLDTVVSLWQPRAIAKGLQFSFQQAPLVPQRILSDESKLRQILMTLLDNAIQLTEAGCVFVQVDVKERVISPTDSTCLLILEMQSTEIGLASNELDAVFQMFSQTGSAQQSIQKLGLSLLLIRQLAQVMGGDLLFKNTPEQGTTITVHIAVGLPTVLNDVELGATTEAATTVDCAPVAPITLELLQTIMPLQWITELHAAAVKGFDQQILQLLKQIPASHAFLATTFEVWTHNFQFDRIVEITQQVPNSQ